MCLSSERMVYRFVFDSTKGKPMDARTLTRYRAVNLHPRVGVGNCMSLGKVRRTAWGVTLDGRYVPPGPRCRTFKGALRKAEKLIKEMDA